MKRGGHIIGAVALAMALISFQHVAPMAAAGGATGDEARAEWLKKTVVRDEATIAFCRKVMPESAADFDTFEARDKAGLASSQDLADKATREIMAAPDFEGLKAKVLKELVDDKETPESLKLRPCTLALEQFKQ